MKTLAWAATFLIFLFLANTQGFSQNISVVSGPEPKGGISKLALEYLRINFTKEQRKALNGVPLEFIYSVNKEGRPTLEKVHGLQDPVILDSLTRVTNQLPPFAPRVENGEAVASLYVMNLEYPASNRSVTLPPGYDVLGFTQAKLEDFESINRNGQSVYVLFGGAANTFLGSPKEYLHVGGGMTIGLMYKGKTGVGAGFLMSFYGNKRKQDFPIAPGREQNSAPPTFMLGVGFNKLLLDRERKEFNVQLDLNYVVQNIVPRSSSKIDDYVQLQGFSPGIVANYLVQVGKSKVSAYYYTPAIQHHYLNFHAGVKPLFLDLNAARGVMLDFGVAYRLGYDFVDGYKLK